MQKFLPSDPDDFVNALLIIKYTPILKI